MTEQEQESYELFRRAIVERNSDAWGAIHQRFGALFASWAWRSAGRSFTADECSDIADQALARAWAALTPERFADFHTLARLLSYLRACVTTTMIDTIRTQIPPENIRRATNHTLPDDILIRSIEPVPRTFDAVTCTASKRYQYFIWNAPDRPPFIPDLTWHRWQKLDVPAMRAAARHLVGTHDFATFARPGHGRETTVRTVLACEVSFRAPRLVIGVEDTGFLWNMVRIIVGTLVEVGFGRHSPDAIPTMLAAKDRRAAGGTAPPHGLYLQWIKFKEPPPAPPPADDAQPRPDLPSPEDE